MLERRNRGVTRGKPVVNDAKKKLASQIDEYCVIQARMREDKKALESLRKVLLPLAEDGVLLATSDWKVVYVETHPSRLDTEKIREEMSDDWIKDHSVTDTVKSLRGQKQDLPVSGGIIHKYPGRYTDE